MKHQTISRYRKHPAISIQVLRTNVRQKHKLLLTWVTEQQKLKIISRWQRIGDLLLAIPKTSGGVNQYNKEEKSERSAKSKSDVINDMGYDRHDASDYQQIVKEAEGKARDKTGLNIGANLHESHEPIRATLKQVCTRYCIFFLGLPPIIGLLAKNLDQYLSEPIDKKFLTP